MNITTTVNEKIYLVLSIFFFLLVADATGKTNELTSHKTNNHQGLFTYSICSDSTKNKVATTDNVIDVEAPVFTIIPRNGIARSLDEVAFDFVMAVDNLSAVSITSTDLIDGNLHSGILTRTWTATDQSGNSSTASASVRYYGNNLHEQNEQLEMELTGKEEQGNIFDLGQNFPNPFSKNTSVPFYLPEADFVTLKIYDASGKTLLVRTGDFEKGANDFDINGSDLQNEGVLYYELVTSNSKHTRKMLFNSNK